MAITKSNVAPINKKIIIYNKEKILDNFKESSVSVLKGTKNVKKKSESGSQKTITSKKNLRIGIFAWNSLYGCNEGPYSSHVSEVATVLNKKGHEVHIFTRKNEGASLDEIDKVFYHFFTIDNSLPILNMAKIFSTSIKKDFSRIEKTKGKFDIVYLYGVEAGLAAKQLIKNNNRKLVLTLTVNELNNLNKKSKTNTLKKELIDFCDDLVIIDNTINKPQKKSFTHLKKNVHLLFDGFHDSYFKGLKDPGKIKKQYNLGPVDPVILFVGSLDHKFGPDIIIEAIPTLLNKHPQLRFIIVGEGELGWNFRIHARYLGFEYALRLLGHKEGWELHELFQACDIIAIPNREYNSPYQILAGWSAKKPVVVTDEGSYGLIQHDKNGIKIYKNSDSFIWAIDKIFSDWNHANKLAKKGWETARDIYSWNNVAQKMLDIY